MSFDWGFAVALALQAIGSLAGLAIVPTLETPLAIGFLVGAALVVALGEALRRGNGLARRFQIAFHSLLMLVGPALILPYVQGIQEGRLVLLSSLILTTLLVYVVSPIEIWLLLQARSRRWYGVVTAQEAASRHSGGWLIGTVVWAVVCGVLQAVAPV